MTKALLSSDKNNGFEAGDSTSERSSTGMEVKVEAGLPASISQSAVIVALYCSDLEGCFAASQT